MTVAELIAKLQQMPPGATVLVQEGDGGALKDARISLEYTGVYREAVVEVFDPEWHPPSTRSAAPAVVIS